MALFNKMLKIVDAPKFSVLNEWQKHIESKNEEVPGKLYNLMKQEFYLGWALSISGMIKHTKERKAEVSNILFEQRKECYDFLKTTSQGRGE